MGGHLIGNLKEIVGSHVDLPDSYLFTSTKGKGLEITLLAKLLLDRSKISYCILPHFVGHKKTREVSKLAGFRTFSVLLEPLIGADGRI